jgi:uncharacterized protein YmfQ (DUF2313 family)
MNEDYIALLQNLLPAGPAFNQEIQRDETGKITGSKLTLLLDIFAKALARVDERASLLIKEANPLTASSMLPARYDEAGLPLSCMQRAPDSESMRAEVLWTWAALGGSSLSYFHFLLTKLGLPVRIREFNQFRIGQTAIGSNPLYGDEWAYLWQITAFDKAYKHFAAGVSSAGDPLQKWGFSAVVCLFNYLKPAHTEIYFKFLPLPVDPWDSSQIDDSDGDYGLPFALLADNLMLPLYTDETIQPLVSDATD